MNCNNNFNNLSSQNLLFFVTKGGARVGSQIYKFQSPLWN